MQRRRARAAAQAALGGGCVHAGRPACRRTCPRAGRGPDRPCPSHGSPPASPPARRSEHERRGWGGRGAWGTPSGAGGRAGGQPGNMGGAHCGAVRDGVGHGRQRLQQLPEALAPRRCDHAVQSSWRDFVAVNVEPADTVRSVAEIISEANTALADGQAQIFNTKVSQQKNCCKIPALPYSAWSQRSSAQQWHF